MAANFTTGNVVVDTRPLGTILLERSLRPTILVVTALIYWFVMTREPPEGLSIEGLHALAIFCVCLVLWVTSALPLMITSLLAIILLPLSGVMPASKAYALFGNEAVFFILGVFILAACLMKSRLSTRLALFVLRRFGHTPRTLLISIFLLNAVMSFFMSEHAVAAMNFPIIMEIVGVLRLPKQRSNYARALFLAMAWGTTIGGVATLLGGARAPLALGMVKEATGQTFTFAEWAIASLPITLGMLVVGYIVIIRFFPIDVASIREADDLLAEKALALGRMSVKEKGIATVMAFTLAGWIIGGEEFGLGSVAIGAVVVLFVLDLVKWQDVEGYVSWGILLMYGGAIALGSATNSSGAADWLSQNTISKWSSSGPGAVGIISALSIVLTELMSNSAVVAMLMPVTLGVAKDFAMDPRVMALVVAVPAGLGFTMPIGTPANAIAYSSGYLSMRDMMVPGAILAVSSWAVFNIVARLFWPLLGISLGTGS
ncbi:MAG TPA: DASS family sodium-coupled anion symporter [Candidatus Binatia bacterium]|jgi:sodium-dependent dicarboxylate transporter 2/3/5|nr:DASS family sodium-coupled anion symporter [Candidatus Binatia bacterium]